MLDTTFVCRNGAPAEKKRADEGLAAEARERLAPRRMTGRADAMVADQLGCLEEEDTLEKLVMMPKC